MGSKFVLLLLFLYAITTILYIIDRDLWRALYWIAAFLITLAVRQMK